MEYGKFEPFKQHLTGLLKAINPAISHIEYLGGYSPDGSGRELRAAMISYGNRQTRTIELWNTADPRQAVLTLVACCFQKSGGGARAGGRKKAKRR